jgi:methyl-accepting chemotaxis protein
MKNDSSNSGQQIPDQKAKRGKRVSSPEAASRPKSGLFSWFGRMRRSKFGENYLNHGPLTRLSIRKQFLIPFITAIVIIGLAGGLFSYFYGANVTENQLRRSTMAQLKATNQNFETYFSDAQSVVGQFSGSQLLNHPVKNQDQINRSFQDVISTNTKYQALTYAMPDKKIIRAPLYFFDKSYDPTKQSWYTTGANGAGKAGWTDPYLDNVTKEYVVSVTKAVMGSGNSQIKGVLKLDLFIQSIVNEVNNTRFGKTGYAFLLDPSGTYITAPKNKLIGTSLAKQPFYQKLITMGKSGSFYGKINGQDKLICFQRNATTGWILIGAIDRSEISGQANLITLPSAVTVLLILLIAIFVTTFLLRGVVSRIRTIQRAARKVEQGDLTVSLPVIGKDELSELTTSINTMAKANRAAFQKMTEVTQRVAGASQTLVASAEENVASTNEISATVQEIAAGATSQSTALDENRNSLESLVTQIRKMDENSKGVLTGANQMSTTSKGGEKAMSHLFTQSKAAAETTGKIIEAVNNLEKQTKNINQIIDVLDSIARRTNLLSLNASIEAAHAGEQGKGFAVVASEIRKLARQTNESLQQVTQTIASMIKETTNAVTLCKQTTESVKAQGEAVEATNNAFKQIETTIEENVKGIRSIVESIRLTQEHTGQISQGMQTIASTSEETAASTEEVSASVEEQTAAMEELNKLAGDLDQQAQLMRDAISRYKI